MTVQEVLRELVTAVGDGERAGLVTVVSTFQSAPRQPGASMAVTASGEAVGSVSGGCIEGAVYELAQEVMAGRPPVLQRYGVSDDDAFAVGLTCGGIIDVFVEAVDRSTFPVLADVAASIDGAEPVAVATVVAGPGPAGAHLVVWTDRVAGSLGGQRLDDAVADDARGMLDQGQTGIRRYGASGERRLDDLQVFVQSFAPRPRMLVFGAIDFAAALVRVGRFLGYHVTVCDARPVFATPRRFPDADEVVVKWPHDYLASTTVDARTVICVLTHDPKFDVPLLAAAVRTPAAYIGVMGSRRTHDDRLARLRAEGLSDDELARLASPLGLDLGARTPEETAVSIAAEIIAARWGGSGRRLSDTSGPIHREHLAADAV
ncbi:xanthine dehydrogenase accessory factor [Jiangella sp. DSM 45060]|nr:XdhC/CoxI family protein [Jiangella sp. DSM 45060]SDS89436.1 xanthine dehydrogenase accessory factor [Jiangella sp. DSM 45060]